MDKFQLPITQQREGKSKSFDRLKLVLRVLGAQPEQVRRARVSEFAKVIAEPAALRGATPRARYGVPTIRDGLIRFAGSRIAIQNRPPADSS